MNGAVLHGDGVADWHAHHAAGEVGGEGLTGYESDAKEQREGSNLVGMAHGICGTGRIAPILLDSGGKGESRDGRVPRSEARHGCRIVRAWIPFVRNPFSSSIQPVGIAWVSSMGMTRDRPRPRSSHPSPVEARQAKVHIH